MTIRIGKGYLLRLLRLFNIWLFPLYFLLIIFFLISAPLIYKIGLIIIIIIANLLCILYGIINKKKDKFRYLVCYDDGFELIDKDNNYLSSDIILELKNPLIVLLTSPWLIGFDMGDSTIVINGEMICSLYISYSDYKKLKKNNYKYIKFLRLKEHMNLFLFDD